MIAAGLGIALNGRPKGTVQNHRNVLHYIRNYTNDLHLGPEDRDADPSDGLGGAGLEPATFGM